MSLSDRLASASRVLLWWTLGAVILLSATASRAEVRLSDNLTSGTGVRDLWISPDRNHVVFSGDLTSPGNSMLYAVNLDSMGSQRQINGLVHPEGSDRYENFGFTSDSQRFLYYSYADRSSGQPWRLSVPLDATGPAEVRITADAGIEVSQLPNTWFSPDRERLIVRGTDPAVGNFDFFSFSVDGGGSAVKISSAPAGRTSFLDIGPYFTTESDIYYVADFSTPGQRSLYKASFSEPGTQVRVGTQAPGGSHFFRIVRITDEMDRAVFVTLSVGPQKYEVQSAPTDGGGEQIQISLLPDDVRIGSLELIRGGTRALYTTFLNTAFGSPRHIYSASTTETGTQFRVNQATDRASVIGVIADGERIVYSGTNATEFVPKIFSASTTVPGTEFQINQAAETVGSLKLLGNGDRAIYIGTPMGGTPTLYAASTLVAGTEVALFENHDPEGAVAHVTTVREGSRVIFYADRDNDNSNELLSLDPNQPANIVAISKPFTPKTSFTSGLLSITPDESRVLYESRADEQRPAAGLHSAPVDQSDAEQTLIRLVTPDTRIEDYQITPDSGFVIARTKVELEGVPYRNALFAVPIVGGVPVRLHNEFVAEGRINSPEIVNNGSKVVYLADSRVDYETRYCSFDSCNPSPFPGAETVSVRVSIQDVFAADLPVGSGLLGDLNLDSILDANDIKSFAVGLLFPEVFAYAYGLDAVNFGDMNGDGFFDEEDIEGFATALSVEEVLISNQLDSLFGDFNGDYVVDAADYTVWRDGIGSDSADIDYYLWRANYGASAMPGGESQTVPEPSALLLTFLVVAGNRLICRHVSSTKRVAGIHFLAS